MQSFYLDNKKLSGRDLHCEWLNEIRDAQWNKCLSEEKVIPSNDALRYHWLRSCFVFRMWGQTLEQNMVIPDMKKYGWEVGLENVSVIWDSKKNLAKIKSKMSFDTNGCGCKSGCLTGRCACKKNGGFCTAGCKCIDCKNLPDEFFDKTETEEMNESDDDIDSDHESVYSEIEIDENVDITLICDEPSLDQFVDNEFDA